jgi:hypothetical protein
MEVRWTYCRGGKDRKGDETWWGELRLATIWIERKKGKKKII